MLFYSPKNFSELKIDYFDHLFLVFFRCRPYGRCFSIAGFGFDRLPGERDWA